MPSQMASSTDQGSLVVSSNLTSTMKTLFKEKRISSCQESDKSLSLGPQRLLKNFGVGTYGPIRRSRIPLFKGGESVIRLSLGRRLVNLSPVAQRTNAFHKWRRRQTMGRWSWVRISRPPWKRFLKKSVFPHVKNLMNHSPWVPRDYKRT